VNDPVLGTLAYPCELCGAEPGQECPEGCPSLTEVDWSAVEGINEYAEVIDTPPMDESLSKLARSVHILPYGNLVGARGMGAPDQQDYSPEEYIARLADWMAEYQPILRAMVDDLQAQSRERISLRLERDIVSGYLKGTPL
jgi:hypothetical protein